MDEKEKGWITIALPIEIVKLVDQVILSNRYGFRSRTDFVLEAVKIRLRDMGYYP